MRLPKFKTNFWARWAIFAAVLYVVLSIVVAAMPAIGKFEAKILKEWIDHRSETILHFAMEAGALGSTMGVILISSTVVAVTLLLRSTRSCLQYLIAVCGSGLITGSSKWLVQRERPEEISESLGFYTSSYPSGHTLTAAAMYFTLALIAVEALKRTNAPSRPRRGLYATAGVLILAVAIARILTATHFPTDSVGGLLAGFFWASMVHAFFTAQDEANA
jgi:undecaprenyl-diphosphatase